MLMH
jgi:hypothetical protein